MSVVIVNHGLSNLDSIARALEECGADVSVTSDPARVRSASRAVLPGVGAFPLAMANLARTGLDDAMREIVQAGRPLLGICLGMQLLADRGEEFGETAGLGLVPGTVRRFDEMATTDRVPHIGWNELRRQNQAPILDGIDADKDFYFVHSYHFDCSDPAAVVATTPYCGGFVSIVNSGCVWGVQFHPEKSQKAGFRLLRNFLAL